MGGRVRILLQTADVKLARALGDRLAAHPSLDVVDAVESCADAVVRAAQLEPHVVVADTGHLVAISVRRDSVDGLGRDHRAVAYVRREHAATMVDVAVGLCAVAAPRG